MSTYPFELRPESPADACAIDALTHEVFGPGMKARAAYALREGVDHHLPLSFIARSGGELIGTVRLTRISLGGACCWLLGPLAVRQSWKNAGIGKALMAKAVDEAGRQRAESGVHAIMLVGDRAYYEPFGFVQAESVELPRPADPSRILMCDLSGGRVPLPRGKASGGR